MADKPFHELSISDAGAALRQGKVTSLALTKHALARIKVLDPKINAFITVTKERALADAARADTELKAGHDHGPFLGIPYGLKDIYDTAGIRTTCHSKLRADVVPRHDSVVAAKLKQVSAFSSYEKKRGAAWLGWRDSILRGLILQVLRVA